MRYSSTFLGRSIFLFPLLPCVCVCVCVWTGCSQRANDVNFFARQRYIDDTTHSHVFQNNFFFRPSTFSPIFRPCQSVYTTTSKIFPTAFCKTLTASKKILTPTTFFFFVRQRFSLSSSCVTTICRRAKKNRPTTDHVVGICDALVGGW